VLAAIAIFLLFAQAEEVTEGNAPAEEVTTGSPPVITGVAAVGKDGETCHDCTCVDDYCICENALCVPSDAADLYVVLKNIHLL
jgi:hypothetical protein